jgi:predicted ABC-type ATPase
LCWQDQMDQGKARLRNILIKWANIRELLSLCDIVHVYDNTFEPVRIIRKHKEDISIFANELWSEEQILELIQ